jgi:indoleamine 2,3-dioxygenase
MRIFSRSTCFVKKSFLLKRNRNFSVQLSKAFKIYEDDDELKNPDLDPYIISTRMGFLPRTDPHLKLPERFEVLNSLLDRMRYFQPDGSPGLLQQVELGRAVRSELPELTTEGIDDKMVLVAILRDYCFLASAYLLEECHQNYLKSGDYGLGRDHLPKNLAKSLVHVADKLNLRPFMEYNTSYALNNWYRIQKDGGIEMNNIDIYRSFVNIKSEAGFILVHVAINQHSGMLIRSGVDVLQAAENKDRDKFNNSLREMRDILIFMNQEFERMYYDSDPNDYNIFRTFIMGIANQPMFPKGVVYDGCYDNKPQYFRGESGANDAIIPFCDNILQITQFLPNNPLTEILRDFRTYRPKVHQEFLSWTEETAKKVNVLDFSRQDGESLLCLLEVADQVRAFRHRHWTLTNLYIINKTKHAVATGGSPITTWLPNQLLSVIDFITANSTYINEAKLPSYLLYNLHAIVNRAEVDKRIITKTRDEKRKKYNQ